MGIFVTATDTGVGKTLVSAALVHWARREGLAVGAMKPAESGCLPGEDGSLVPQDAMLLREAAAQPSDPLDLVCPFRLRQPLAPGIAALREGVEVDLTRIRAVYEELSSRHPDGMVVEGAGGLLVPMDGEFHTVADLALLLGLPAVIVARGGLGTINHTALTVEALRTRGIPCKGVILSAQGGTAEVARANGEAIRRLCGVEILSVLPPLEGGSEWERVVAASRILGEDLGRKLDPRAFFA